MNYNNEYKKLVNRQKQITTKIESNEQKLKALELKVVEENEPLKAELVDINKKIKAFDKLAQSLGLDNNDNDHNDNNYDYEVDVYE